MVLGLISQVITDLIEIYLLFNGIISSFESLIGSNSTIESGPTYFPYISYKSCLKGITFLGIILLVIRNSIMRNSVIIKYRIVRDPIALDLIKSNLNRQTERINLIFKKENDCGRWFEFLDYMGFLLLVKIDYPLGVTMSTDRESLPVEFKIVSKTSQSVSYTVPLHANGRRQIHIDVSLRDDTSFEGNEPINIKTFITCRASCPLNLIKFEIGYDSVDIHA